MALQHEASINFGLLFLLAEVLLQCSVSPPVCFEKRLGWIAEIWVKIGYKESTGLAAAILPLIGWILTIPPSHWSEEASLFPGEPEERVITASTSSSLGGNIGDNARNITSEACILSGC